MGRTAVQHLAHVAACATLTSNCRALGFLLLQTVAQALNDVLHVDDASLNSWLELLTDKVLSCLCFFTAAAGQKELSAMGSSKQHQGKH